jgi:hypothetical protein
MMEGSGSVPLTHGSGSGRPKINGSGSGTLVAGQMFLSRIGSRVRVPDENAAQYFGI